MRLLIAPSEFKGTLTAAQAADAIGEGVKQVIANAELDVCPIADGGPGTVDAVLAALPGERRREQVEGPLGGPVSAVWGKIGDLGVIEMAAASGLSLVPHHGLRASFASTYGTGQLIRAALDAGCKQLLVGMGGSATTDGGTGCAEAVGAAFFDEANRPLPRGGGALLRLSRIDASGLDKRLREVELTVICDVTNPLFGPKGAAFVYGPQKGADEAEVWQLDRALQQLARVVEQGLGVRAAEEPGMGAAGGLSYGLRVFLGGKLVRGFDHLASLLEIDRRIDAADWVLTGEGRLDQQTAFGKGPGELAQRARRKGKGTAAFVGMVDASFDRQRSPFDHVTPLVGQGVTPAQARAAAREFLQRAAASWARKTFP